MRKADELIEWQVTYRPANSGEDDLIRFLDWLFSRPLKSEGSLPAEKQRLASTSVDSPLYCTLRSQQTSEGASPEKARNCR